MRINVNSNFEEGILVLSADGDGKGRLTVLPTNTDENELLKIDKEQIWHITSGKRAKIGWGDRFRYTGILE